jgi:hypothetical protein
VAVLVAVNLLVFLTLPVVFGSQYPTRLDRFGADWGPLTLSGQWWRLLTSTFVHIELSHLLFNMVGLWLLGKRVERVIRAWDLPASIFCLRVHRGYDGSGITPRRRFLWGVRGRDGRSWGNHSCLRRPLGEIVLERTWEAHSTYPVSRLRRTIRVFERPVCRSRCRVIGGHVPCCLFHLLRNKHSEQVLDLRCGIGVASSRWRRDSPALSVCLKNRWRKITSPSDMDRNPATDGTFTGSLNRR